MNFYHYIVNCGYIIKHSTKT